MSEKAEKSFGRVHRTIGRYATIPREILDDTSLSHLAVRVAAVLSSNINYAPWNTDGHVDMSYPELARLCGVRKRQTVMEAVAELEMTGGIVPPKSLKGRGGMRFRFNTGWTDEDEDDYCRWAANGFQVEGSSWTTGDPQGPYCDALELGFPTMDPREPFVRRALRDVQTFVMKHPAYSSRLYVMAIRERVAELRKANVAVVLTSGHSISDEEASANYRKALRALMKAGPRPSPKLISTAERTASHSSGPIEV